MDSATSYLGQLVTVEIDRPLDSRHPKHGFRYELNYGYVPGTMAGVGEVLDAYIIGVSEPLKQFRGRCLVVIHRTDDNDDKLVVVPDGFREVSDEEIRKLTLFQEQFFHSAIVRERPPS